MCEFLISRARELLKANDVDGVIRLLERAVALVPEYTDAQTLLSMQYRRNGNVDGAIRAAIQAIISPPCFGSRPTALLLWLSRQTDCPPDLVSDPVWANRARLTLKFGGVRENDDYGILRDAIDNYLGASAFIPAMTLMQAYGELMSAETVSFQERCGFDIEAFLAWQRDVATLKYGKSRECRIQL